MHRSLHIERSLRIIQKAFYVGESKVNKDKINENMDNLEKPEEN